MELLVAISIFVVLATLTLGAFRSNNADRVSASAGTLKAALEGARSRAIKSGQIRGLRLVTDPNDGRIVTSLAYVGASGYDEGLGTIEYVPHPTISGAGSWFIINQDDPDPALPRNHAVNVANETWDQLVEKGLLIPGLKIEIPRDSGKWYTVNSIHRNSWQDPYTTALTADRLLISEHFQPSQPAIETVPPFRRTFEAIPTTNVPFRLALAPTVLEGTEPVLLTAQTCIDLDGSAVPRFWRPSGSTLGDRYGNSMDIYFSPNGALTGALKSEGVLHFRIGHVSDVTMAHAARGSTYTSSSNPYYRVPADPEKEHMAVSVFTQTGAVFSSDINPETGVGTLTDGFNNDVAVAPFAFALRGKGGR